MKERPILFSAPMVRAILNGTKTQTRRVVKPQPEWDGKWFKWDGHRPGSPYGACSGNTLNASMMMGWSCPYGQPGDRLWLRETWMADPPRDGTWPSTAFDGCKPRDHALIPEHYRKSAHCLYRADGHDLHGWTPAIHMYRWASRITLEITGVRVERLQDISEADAIAEGIERSYDQWRDYRTDQAVNYPSAATPIDSYRTLWEDINGPGSWDANPFVWMVEFKRVEGGAA